MWQMLGLVALGYGAICAGVYLGQHRLIYFPDRSVRATPERVGLDYEDVWLGAEGGGSWYRRASLVRQAYSTTESRADDVCAAGKPTASGSRLAA